MPSSQGAGRGLHSYENTHFTAGQRTVRAVWTLPLGGQLGRPRHVMRGCFLISITKAHTIIQTLAGGGSMRSEKRSLKACSR
jgi:hypothetical protein